MSSMQYRESSPSRGSTKTRSVGSKSMSNSRSRSRIRDSKRYTIDEIYSSVSNKRDYEPRSDDSEPLLTPRSELACKRCVYLFLLI